MNKFDDVKNMDEPEETKRNASGKELLMIVVVVILAFGLTVAGIVYLTSFLIGNDSTRTAPQSTQNAPLDVNGDTVVRFSVDSNTTGTNINPENINPPVAAQPVPISPAPAVPQSVPVVVTPPPVVRPPAQPAPAVTTKPAAVAPAAPKPATTTSQPKPAKPTAPASATPAKGAFQLQLSAFRDPNKASAEVEKYKSAFPDIHMIKVDMGADGIWYRVRCCSSDSRQDLTVKKDKMQEQYGITPFIVVAN